MGLFPESLGGLRGLSVLLRCAVGGQKQLEKSANHFINAHCSRAKRWQRQRLQRRRPPQLPASRCDVSDLQLCCARLHLGGCTSFGLMDPAPPPPPPANAGTTTMTTCNKNVASFALTRKKFSYVCTDRELKEAKKSREKMSSASSSFSDVFRYARCCNIVAWEWIARVAKLQSSPLPESDLTHSFIHSLTHEHSIEYFNWVPA